ncbi:MAG: fucose isomerase, partial [bacterium]|nr:fucose isomerase [bacterium]
KKDVSENDILGAVKIYLGLKRTISEHNLSALTLRCFDLLKAFNNTGCLALARLNDEGIPAGCEGDIPALFTMMINHLITGAPSFMANPSLIHENNITLAHCTIPLSITESFGFETHFESGIGVGITGKIKKGPVTLTKIGGPHLDRFYVAEGEMTAVPQSGELCRTQVTIKMEEPLDYFFNSPLGNHHIISSGRHATRFKEIMALFN